MDQPNISNLSGAQQADGFLVPYRLSVIPLHPGYDRLLLVPGLTRDRSKRRSLERSRLKAGTSVSGLELEVAASHVPATGQGGDRAAIRPRQRAPAKIGYQPK